MGPQQDALRLAAETEGDSPIFAARKLGQSPARWETEAFLLRAEGRSELLELIRTLADYLRRTPSVALVDLAFTLNTSAGARGRCLALVAGSPADLLARLERAAGRLADPACRQINDSQGIYYAEEPLCAQGRLAFLFPGEGAQYLNMLRDLLPWFPECREHFDRCDRVSLSAGKRQEPLSRSIFLPESASPEERRRAEADLSRLDNGTASVMTANWAMYLVLRQLALRPDAVAGHSCGETTALAAAGCIDVDDHLLMQLFALGHVLQQEENAGSMADAALLAVGAGRRQVAQWLDGISADAFIAIDNCPHQTVVSGTVAAVEVLEQRLQEAGIFYERLPFNRPYHAPLFQRYMDPVVEMYETIPFRAPRTTIYSCSTGRPMPHDPAEVRRLAAWQWTARVEFTSLIEAMYADGVRLFVEVGPRGNLSSFVQDILRGRSLLAVPSNVCQRSGITQLNHLVAQLAAHDVPLELEYLYRRRGPRFVYLAPGEYTRGEHTRCGSPALGAPAVCGAPPVYSRGAKCARGADSRREAVLSRHFQVMADFLKVQEDLHRRFLLAQGGSVGLSSSALACTGGQATSATPPGGEATSAAPVPAAKGPMIGELIEHEPGRALLMRRRIDLDEDLYARDHTLGGRHASAIDPEHNGLAVMPMALNLEMMAEVASLLVPGKRVVGFQRVRLQRWIPLYEEPVTLEVRARVVPVSSPPVASATHAVAIEIRDLGNASQPGHAESPSVEGTALLAAEYPSPPQAGPFPLANERPCPIGPDELYGQARRLFHGPLFEVAAAVDRMGDDGVEGELLTLSHAGLFRSTSQPNLLLDPLLIDGSTHVLGSWHLSQADQAGRVVFPYELGTVQVFGPRPAEGTRLKCRVCIERLSARQVSHRIDIINPDGKLWCRLHPAEYWRFYWPQECVDFFRHHEEYLLTADWPAALPATAVGSNGGGPRAAQASLRCFRTREAPDLVQPVIRAALARVALSPAEWQQFYRLPGPDQRRTEWLFGRLAAKDCLRALWQQAHGQRLFPADIEIETDPLGRPVARHRGFAAELPQISIAHSDGICAALAAFGRPVGLDLERIRPRSPRFQEIALDQRERELLDRCGAERDEAITRFWCAKEAVAKALGHGLVEGPQTVVVRDVDPQGETLRLALGAKLAAAFPELQSALLLAWTHRDGDYIVATTFAEKDCVR